MSGFLPDLASWALRGVGGGSRSNNDNDNGEDNNTSVNNNGSSGIEPPPLTPEEMRAQRIARMEELQKRQEEQLQESKASGSMTQPEEQQEAVQMDIDESDDVVTLEAPGSHPTESPALLVASIPMEASSTTAAVVDSPVTVTNNTFPATNAPAAASSSLASTSLENKSNTVKQSSIPQNEIFKKQKRAKAETTMDGDRKQQRKKELLLKKVLSIALVGTNMATTVNTSSDAAGGLTLVDIDSTEISVQSIAEILATRLTMQTPHAKPLIAYLASCHLRAAEEMQTLQQSKNTSSPQTVIMKELCEEIQRQVVSYAASCLMEPDLFEAGRDAIQQLTNCFLGVSPSSSMDSITVGISGTSSSFYYCLVEEILQQDADLLEKIVQEQTDMLFSKLIQIESVLDGVDGADGRMTVSALTGICLHKRAAEAMTRTSKFLLPPADSIEANELIRPVSQGILQLFSGENRPYKKRSGPALEKQTILGAALRLGVPKNNAAFSPSSILTQSMDSVDRATSLQRTQLQIHQEACCQFVLSLIKAGTEARSKVIKWFIDALLVNSGASALRPDPSKISSLNTRLNMSVVLLKLCEPFLDDDKKIKLIDPGFVSASEAHQGVYASTGDDAVSRLGGEEEDQDVEMSDADGVASTSNSNKKPYNPKNTFIPTCFFLCARSIHLGLSPALSYHEGLLRHLSHAHHELTVNGRDIRTDPHFGLLLSKQRSAEVALFQPSMVIDTIRFLNLLARVLGEEISDDVLKTMPEDFVSELCNTLMTIAKVKPKLLANVSLRSVFKLVVKLLSSKYASMVRNYNLRAMLGDVLYELFLPSSFDDHRDVPSSVWTDGSAGGLPYLLSDTSAQETLAPSLLLLYGEVEHTGYYDKMSHRAKIASLIKYLWESSEHRTAFRNITQNKASFIKFANGIMNETNTLIATVMQKLPEIREAQERMEDAVTWSQLSEDQQTQISSRLEDNEREVKHALPLCNKTLQMFGYLNTDPDIRSLFLLEELCPRLVAMLLHVLTKLVGSKGLDLKVNNPEQYDFRPKEMLRDLCAIFALFSGSTIFQEECAKSGCDPNLLRSAVKTCRRLNLLTGASLTAFESLPDIVETALQRVAADEALLADAPDEFLDEILTSYMNDPVILPSGHTVDRSTITQHLLNDPSDPFNREPLTLNDIQPATELKARMDQWLQEKRAARDCQ